MNRIVRTYTIATATILGWAAMIVDVLPWGPDLPDDVSRLALVMAGAGSCVLAIRSKSRPAVEMFEMGFESGRRQAKIDSAVERVSRSNVVVPFRRAE